MVRLVFYAGELGLGEPQTEDRTMSKLDECAKAGMEAMFEERWDDLVPDSIDRALWKDVVRAVLACLAKPSEAVDNAGARAISDRFARDGGFCGQEAAREMAIEAKAAMLKAVEG